MLNHRKARSAPEIAAQKEAKSILFCEKEIKANEPKAMSNIPPFNPSKPSVSLEDMAVKRIMKMKSGIYQRPMLKSPINGICSESQFNL